MKSRMILGGFVTLVLLTAFIPQYSDSPLTFDDSNLRVMNFNLHFGVELNAGYDLSGFKTVIEDAKPDIVAFQEVTYNAVFNGFTNMYGDLKDMMDAMGYKYSYFASGDKYYLRNAVFSRHEIVDSQLYDMEENIRYHRSIIDITVKFNGIEVHVLVSHLTHLPVDDDGEPISGDVRIAQIKELVAYAESLNSDNIIALGDFNMLDTWDDEYLPITTFFNDAWNMTHPGEDGFTFPAHPDFSDLSDRRIDYVFITPSITANDCEVIDTIVSDHRPIFCDLVIS